MVEDNNPIDDPQTAATSPVRRPPLYIRIIKLTLFFVIGCYIVSILLLDRIVFLPWIPGRTIVADPSHLGLSFEKVTFPTVDGLTLHGWFVPGGTDEATVLFFHGNAGNISHRLGPIDLFHRLGFNFLIFDYRGYGNSEGSPDEEGLYDDAHAAFRYLTEVRQIPAGRIALVGHSLGAAAAADLSTDVGAPILVLESTFASLRSVGSKIFPHFLYGPFIPEKFNSARKLRRSQAKVIVIAHSKDDPVIPYSEGERLATVIPDRTKFFTLTSAGHDESCPDPAYLSQLPGLIRDATRLETIAR